MAKVPEAMPTAATVSEASEGGVGDGVGDGGGDGVGGDGNGGGVIGDGEGVGEGVRGELADQEVDAPRGEPRTRAAPCQRGRA